MELSFARANESACREIRSSSLLTGYLPLSSIRYLPTFSMRSRKSLRRLACIPRATAINSPAT
jgi:hypothetical protein